eukprot:CAMPEP_0170237664 /NCGR_PEP_ID=MMETSP0116_2-20130129/18583_1 /TAXON_ID=400756 /ORGANISM="Durinskia baltica, Strain CSIRO CS-38" /LENGTH=244 /DNA_ID=CAMNT_0010488469 /DNA_START=410 /DNA_END=1141 /DNA_ORIENTATION=+
MAQGSIAAPSRRSKTTTATCCRPWRCSHHLWGKALFFKKAVPWPASTRRQCWASLPESHCQLDIRTSGIAVTVDDHAEALRRAWHQENGVEGILLIICGLDELLANRAEARPSLHRLAFPEGDFMQGHAVLVPVTQLEAVQLLVYASSATFDAEAVVPVAASPNGWLPRSCGDWFSGSLSAPLASSIKCSVPPTCGALLPGSSSATLAAFPPTVGYGQAAAVLVSGASSAEMATHAAKLASNMH